MGDELVCKPGMKLVSGPAKWTDPEGKVASFCIDEHEVTNAEFYGSPVEESKFELVQKDCATGTWVVVGDPRDTAEELASSFAKVPVDGKNVCGVEIRRQAPAMTGYKGDPADLQKPVVNVSWNKARAYCQARGGDLPTGKQWEKAARGPKGYPFATKSGELKKSEANFNLDGAVDVMSYPPNEYGLYDMTANVWEWVLDGRRGTWFKEIRGGAWNVGDPWFLYADSHGHLPHPDSRNNYVGLRCVAEPQGSQE